MMLLKSKHGFTLLEAIASVAIITLVFTTALVTITAMRNQTIATENKRMAVEIASSIRDDMIQSLTFDTLALWIGSTEKTIGITSCNQIGSPVGCSTFEVLSTNQIQSDDITIIFYVPTPEETTHKIIRFSISVVYYKTRITTIEGVIYA